MNRKPLFDTLRRLLGRGFRQHEVDAVDRALDQALGLREETAADDGTPALPLPLPRPRRIGPAGIALIRQFEGLARMRPDGRVEAYPDPGTGGDPWTIGWGATGKGIGPGTVWTRAQCDQRLESDLVRYAMDVDRALGDAPTTQAQFDALVSFHYNTGAIARATLTRKHASGDHAGAQAEFARWNRAGGRVLNGLMRRRAAEAALYGKGVEQAQSAR